MALTKEELEQQRKRDHQIDALIAEQARTNAKVVQIFERVEGHLRAEHSYKAQIAELLKDQEQRIRQNEEARLRVASILPDRIISADEINGRFQVVETNIDKIQWTIIKWAAISGSAAGTAAQVAGPAINSVISLFAGGSQ